SEAKIRFIGDANKRIQEDYLRILRFFRFYSNFNEKEIYDGPSFSACVKHARGLLQISRERIWMELSKILVSPKAKKVINDMKVSNILRVIYPGDANTSYFYCMIDIEHLMELDPCPIRRLASLYAKFQSDNDILFEFFKLSKEDYKR